MSLSARLLYAQAGGLTSDMNLIIVETGIDEPYLIPAASFAVAGGLLGGTLVGAPLVLWALSHEESVPPGTDRSHANFFYPLILITSISAGIFVGGWAGLALERRLRGPFDTKVMLVPNADGASLFMVGRF